MHDLVSWRSSERSTICVCGIGARTPLGFDVLASTAAVDAGISAVEAHPVFVDKVEEPMCLALDADLSITTPLSERVEHMLHAAVAQAADSMTANRVRIPCPCWVGIPEPRPGLPDLTVPVRRALTTAGLSGSSPIHILPYGHASGLMALQLAAQAITAGESEICLVAGADSYHDPATVEWLDRAGLLLSSENRNGFPPGEAAGACLLASVHTAKRYELPVFAHLVAAATTFEPKSIRNAEAVCIGEALTEAVMEVTSPLNVPTEAITRTYCDLNGERYRNEEFVYTLLRVQEVFVDAHDYLSPADCWGDIGAASGVLFLALAIASFERGYTTGTLPLLWAGGVSGRRAALVLRLLQQYQTEDA